MSFMMCFTMMCCSHAFSQFAPTEFIHYTVKEGLSDNNVSCITQDSRGFIWIGTEFGLNRYDGYQFENFYQGSPEGFLTSSIIHKFSHLPGNRLAIITRNGLQVINTEDFSIRQYVIPDSTSFMVQLNYFLDAREFRDGTLGTTTGTGIYVFDSSATLLYRHDAIDKDDQGNERL
jgi:ligand-binding sensor domain-containing protein